MYEHLREPLISRSAFMRRLGAHICVAAAFVTVSLAIGILGYRLIERMEWIDAFLNASMILGGMGPVGELHTAAGKLFAGMYALYSGFVVLFAAGLLFAPIFHRFLHHIHLDVSDDETKGDSS